MSHSWGQQDTPQTVLSSSVLFSFWKLPLCSVLFGTVVPHTKWTGALAQDWALYVWKGLFLVFPGMLKTLLCVVMQGPATTLPSLNKDEYYCLILMFELGCYWLPERSFVVVFKMILTEENWLEALQEVYDPVIWSSSAGSGKKGLD